MIHPNSREKERILRCVRQNNRYTRDETPLYTQKQYEKRNEKLKKVDAKQMAKKRTFVSSAQFPSLYNTQTHTQKKAKEETITIKM